MLHVLVCHKADEAWMTAWTSTVDSWAVNNPSSYGVLDSIKLHLDNWRKSRPPPSLSLPSMSSDCLTGTYSHGLAKLPGRVPCNRMGGGSS
eukprot:scaffold143557_cov74-Attheya_sp.AAC.1